jgi:hypothetical protein
MQEVKTWYRGGAHLRLDDYLANLINVGYKIEQVIATGYNNYDGNLNSATVIVSKKKK